MVPAECTHRICQQVLRLQVQVQVQVPSTTCLLNEVSEVWWTISVKCLECQSGKLEPYMYAIQSVASGVV